MDDLSHTFAGMSGAPRDYLLMPPPAITIAQIQREVCVKYGISMTELTSLRRKHVRARFEAYWRAREETAASYPMIAHAFNRDDHTTIMHGVGQYEKRWMNGPT